MNLRVLLISCLWLTPAFLAAQQPGFQEVSWDLEEVLSPSSIIEDANGYLWMANEEIVYRYDGYTFTAFQPGDSVEGRITALYPWGESSVMAGTEEGWLWTTGGREEFTPIRMADAGIQALHI